MVMIGVSGRAFAPDERTEPSAQVQHACTKAGSGGQKVAAFFLQ